MDYDLDYSNYNHLDILWKSWSYVFREKAKGELPKVPKMIEKIEIDYHDEIQLFFKGDRLYGIIGDFPHFPELIEIDQENGEIVKRIQLEKKFHGGFRSATSDGENFWLSSRGSNHELVKVSQKGEILEVIRTTFQNMTFAWSDNYLWIYGGEKIYKFDVNEGKVLDEIDFPNRISSMDSHGK